MPNSFTVTSDSDEPEGCDYYLCAPASMPAVFDDDVYDFCSVCGQKVRHRPTGPVAPKKICIICAAPDMEQARANDELEVVITPQTATELDQFFGKKEGTS